MACLMVLHLVELLRGQQLQAVDAQALQVVQLLREASVRACTALKSLVRLRGYSATLKSRNVGVAAPFAAVLLDHIRPFQF